MPDFQYGKAVHMAQAAPDSIESQIQAAARVRFNAIMSVLHDNGGHVYKPQRCECCDQITLLCGRPFGCVLLKRRRDDVDTPEHIREAQ